MKLEFLLQDNYDQGVADAEAKAEAKAQKAIAKAEAKAQKSIATAEAKAKEEKDCSVRAFYEKRIPIETIAECTNLSLAEVKKIISTK